MTTTNNSPAPVPVVPGTLNASGNPQFVQGSPEFIEAARIAKEASRIALRKAAADYGVNDTFLITYPGPNGGVFLQIDADRTVDISSYFESIPKPPVAIDVSVPTYGTSTVQTPFRTVEVQALPATPTTVTTSGGPIQVDPTSEVARFLQWQGSQPDPVSGGTIGQTWARQGIANPYANARLVEQAQAQIALSLIHI